ncbi:hypothetical protein K443DRAFT_665807 [Laccaria amethystina LaAM-08-1]|uniref:Uncharacterized protein n=1 Tax=Laccaria amethystina LaAM-08-1 TaxID=1095629 RepID=A0A0C9XRY6_9AGAR|nr:hypothetical protein K443DRAFT_665807 [Laccaria amethystina LaAM-08-1]
MPLEVPVSARSIAIRSLFQPHHTQRAFTDTKPFDELHSVRFSAEGGEERKIGKILERYPGRTYEIVWKLGFGGNMTNLLAISIIAVAIQRLRNDFWQSKPSPDINMTAGILLKKPFELSMGRVTKTNPQHLGYQQGYFEAPTESIDKIVWNLDLSESHYYGEVAIAPHLRDILVVKLADFGEKNFVASTTNSSVDKLEWVQGNFFASGHSARIPPKRTLHGINDISDIGSAATFMGRCLTTDPYKIRNLPTHQLISPNEHQITLLNETTMTTYTTVC